MSYRLSHLGEAAAAAAVAPAAPPPDPTSQALAILGHLLVPVLPIGFGIAGGMYVGKGQSAVAPVAGGLIGGLISVLYLRSMVLAGSASYSLKEAA